MVESIALLISQMNPTLGAIEHNAQAIIADIQNYQRDHDCLVFPELSVSGYPPEDLLFQPELYQRLETSLRHIAQQVRDCYVIVGHPVQSKGQYFNRISIFYQQQCVAQYDKQALPNYGVFDEQRYFTAGATIPCILTLKGQRLGLCICEDLWQGEPVERLLQAGIDHLLCINASPFEKGKYERRLALAQRYAARGVNVIYVNLFGGQDELVFDGRSFVMDKQGEVVVSLPAFQTATARVELLPERISGPQNSAPDAVALMYQALVCATADYVNKNGFKGVLLGLSGGIDSALTLVIAVDALGSERVHAVMMPSRYTADMSREDACAELQALQVASTVLDIEPIYRSFLSTLAEPFQGQAADTTEENLQARIRGTLLMALSNKWGHLVLTTSNKSEVAVGYSTLYGDMAGGFAVLKDVLKTEVYALARWRNQQAAVIPERVILRPPSAELAENQTDQDSLPDYALLDAIISAIMEENADRALLLTRGFPADAVEQVLTLIRRNEYKRRQSAPGPKLSLRAFGKDWRQPITNGW
ncbi:MAG: NAD+ synthase [Legionellaceae bacterium]|nr:NAD+ synthase [Legionellaceae bacterium]